MHHIFSEQPITYGVGMRLPLIFHYQRMHMRQDIQCLKKPSYQIINIIMALDLG